MQRVGWPLRLKRAHCITSRCLIETKSAAQRLFVCFERMRCALGNARKGNGNLLLATMAYPWGQNLGSRVRVMVLTKFCVNSIDNTDHSCANFM
jgi:hypothetical protein